MAHVSLLPLSGNEPRAEGHLQRARHRGPVEGLECCRGQGQRGISGPALHLLLGQGVGE